MTKGKGALFEGTNVSDVKSTLITFPPSEDGERCVTDVRIRATTRFETYETASMWTYVARNFALGYFEQRRHLRRRLPRGQHRVVVEAGRREFWRKPVVATIAGIETREPRKPRKRTLTDACRAELPHQIVEIETRDGTKHRRT